MTTTQMMIEQLGGNRIFAMAFDRATANGNQLTLRIAPALVRGAKDRATHVRISLEASDTYTVEVLRYPRGRVEGMVVAYDEMVYADSLKQLVEARTGLRLSL